MLQDLDEKRIKNIKNFMLSSVDVERKVFPIIMQCLEGMEQAANSINEKEVCNISHLLDITCSISGSIRVERYIAKQNKLHRYTSPLDSYLSLAIFMAVISNIWQSKIRIRIMRCYK